MEKNFKKQEESITGISQVNNFRFLTNSVPCDRCNGTGYLMQFRHIEGGICFKCRGKKEILSYSIIF